MVRGFLMPKNRKGLDNMNDFVATLKGALAAAFPQTRAEQAAMGAGAGLGAILGLVFGALDQAILALCALAMLDFLTGWAASSREGALKSSKGWLGIGKKAAMFGVVAFSNLMDKGMGTNMLREMAICAYSANEGLSILENIDRMGCGQYIPGFLKSKIAQIRAEKAEGGGAKDDGNNP
jgi:toxin secretion/phage lysis holin